MHICPGGAKTWWWQQLAFVRSLGTGDKLGGCIALPSAAGEDGQTAEIGSLQS